MDSRDTRSGAFTLTFTLIFTLIFTLTFTLHLQIDGASSCSIERHFLQYNFQHILRLFCFFQFSMYAGVQGYEQCSLN